MSGRRNFCFAILLVVLVGCASEFEGDGNRDHLFMKFYGGAGSDSGNALIKFNDGYALVGSSTSFGSGDSDLFIVITDENGNARVNKGIGGKGEQYGKGLIQINEHLLAVGHLEDSTGNSDIWLLEISPEGDSLASWRLGSPDVDEQGVDLKIMTNDNLVITAARYLSQDNPDTYLLNLNPQKEIVWENKNALNNLSDYFGKNIIEYANEELVYCSTSKRSATGNTDVRLTAINAIGEVSWNTYFGENTTVDEVHALIEHGGMIWLTGSRSPSSGGDKDVLFVKTNRAGSGATVFTVGVPGVSETGNQLVSLSDGNLLLVGEKQDAGSNFKDIYIEKIDPQGNALWEAPYILSGSLDDTALDALEEENGDLVICGTVSFSGNPMALLLKFNKDGKLVNP